MAVPPEKLKDFIEIKLLDDNQKPIANAPYELALPDGRVVKGRLDGNGFARVDGVPSGECTVTFTEHDGASEAEGLSS